MKCLVTVTFEFDTNPPLTWRGHVTATGIQTIVSRAVSQAKREYPNRGWSSLVVCVLERVGEENDETPEPEAVTASVMDGGVFTAVVLDMR
jgi:hypothetical protein